MPAMEMLARIPGDRQPIAKRTVKDQISDKLAYMIHSGLLRIGDELPSERELASTLGVSRESVSGLGDLKSRSFEEVAEARAAVEVQVIWLAAQRISSQQIERLEILVGEQALMLTDPVRFQISDQEFHNTLYRACGNGLL